MNILCVLQQMWDDRRAGLEAPITFQPNPNNATARKLYRVTRGHLMLFTNACATVAAKPTEKMPPLTEKDTLHLHSAIVSERWDVVLVCGKPARIAMEKLREGLRVERFLFPVVYMPHPSCRVVTNALLAGVWQYLQVKPHADVEFIQHRGSFEMRPA